MATAAPHPIRREFPRRRFLRLALGGAAGLLAAGGGYSLLEAGWLRLTRVTVLVPCLPRPFAGKTVALLADIHHGRHTGLAYVRRMVQMTNGAAPDLIALVGDYVHGDARYIAPCFEALRELRAPLGVYAVLGNHDRWANGLQTRQAIAAAGITNLTNTGVWVQVDGARMRVAGVGDLWTESQDLAAALGDTAPNETCLLLCHNPDYTEGITDPRVGLVLSGHTHGGQVQCPWVGAFITPSRYGLKYLEGLVRTPYTQVYISRGIGTIWPPMRFLCRPEIVLLTLA
jgi:predicted MPP superfamily phosphohydrolase